MHGARREGPVTRLVTLGLELTIGRKGPHPRRRHLQDTRYLRGRVGLLLHSRYPTLNPSLAACQKQTHACRPPAAGDLPLQRLATPSSHTASWSHESPLRGFALEGSLRGAAGRHGRICTMSGRGGGEVYDAVVVG